MLSDLLNYGRTARALYMSQPTITFQIKSLEEAFGVKLFERDRQQVRLTPAGAAFREYAQSIMDSVDAAQECLANLHTRMRLRISCGPVGQFVLLPSVIRSLTAKHPDFELEVSELTTEQMMARLPEGKIDALLMVGSLPIKGLRFDPLCQEPHVAIVSRDSIFAARGFISVEDLRHTPVIASRNKDCRFHQPYLHNLLAPWGISPRIVESPQSCSVQFAYAAAGEGIAISTRSMSACAFPHVMAVPFAEKLPEMQLGLASMESNDAGAMKIFRKVVAECAAPARELKEARKDRAAVAATAHPSPLGAPATARSIAILSRREAS